MLEIYLEKTDKLMINRKFGVQKQFAVYLQDFEKKHRTAKVFPVYKTQS